MKSRTDSLRERISLPDGFNATSTSTSRRSGRQLAEQNVQTFAAWVASKTDHNFRDMQNRGVLSRKEIAVECGFAKSVLDQNPRIKAALRELEDGLRLRGVLPLSAKRCVVESHVPVARETGRPSSDLDYDRLHRLEQENAYLKAEVAELKRCIDKYAVLRDALSQTGRLMR